MRNTRVAARQPRCGGGPPLAMSRALRYILRDKVNWVCGKGYRLKSQLMKDEFDKAGPVLHLLLRYTQALITQMSQTAVCNRHHSLDQQCVAGC